MKKRSGILMHPTSFPGGYGCGSLDENAYKLIDLLAESNQTLLQVLALGPTGFGDSPYMAFSAFAGTPYIISFDTLIKKGYLEEDDLRDYPACDPGRVSYLTLYENNFRILRRAFNRFKNAGPNGAYREFVKEHGYWLHDYALFMAIKDSKLGADWSLWEEDLRLRKNLHNLSDDILEDAELYKFIQFEYFSQWTAFKKYANDRGILIVGDAPIFVSCDSSDVWANQDLFLLDQKARPKVVAGVPPDYFSETGQLWGNPHYNWKKMKKRQFQWWKQRVAHSLTQFDCLRIDHFRGFEAYWEVPFGEKTAINGKWIKGPGKELFLALKEVCGEKLGDCIIAEDLGVITPEVQDLRDSFELPGMKIFQFGSYNGRWEEQEGDEYNFIGPHFLPHNYKENSIAYTGTHDNDLLIGWYESLSPEEQGGVLKYLELEDSKDLTWSVLEKILSSRSKWTIFPIQDVLGLGSEARINIPGTCGTHNWSWRLTGGGLEKAKDSFKKLAELTGKAGRV